MGEEDRTPAGFVFHAFQDVLEERIVGSALGRKAKNVSTVLVRLKGFAVPLADGIGRIGQHPIKLFQPPPLHKCRCRKGVSVDDVEVLNTVEEQVHPPDGAGCFGRGR